MDTKLLELIVCPVTKGPLTMSVDKSELISYAARLAYPIRDGIPVMLVESAILPGQSDEGPNEA